MTDVNDPYRTLLSGALALILLCVAGSLQAAPRTDAIDIETRSSEQARFFGYWTVKRETGWVIRGNLRKSPARQGLIQGVIRVQVLGAGEKVLDEFEVAHPKLPRHGSSVRFRVEIGELPPEAECIRLIHAA